MKVKIKVQRHLVQAWKAADSGGFIFIMCRAGIREGLQEKGFDGVLKTGGEYLIELEATMIEELNHDK